MENLLKLQHEFETLLNEKINLDKGRNTMVREINKLIQFTNYTWWEKDHAEYAKARIPGSIDLNQFTLSYV